MDGRDLDEVIENSHQIVNELEKLDLEGKFEQVSLDVIISEIRKEAKSLSDSATLKITSKSIVNAQRLDNVTYVKFLKRVEKRLRKLSLYENGLRPVLKKITGGFYGKRIINGKALLQYNDAEFVDVLYRSVLGREADNEGRKNNLLTLRSGNCSKIDMVYAFVNSEEAKKIFQIQISGIRFYGFLNRIKHIALKIPVIGTFVKLVLNLCLLPNKILNLQRVHAETLLRLSDLAEKLQQQEIILSQTESKTRHIENQILPIVGQKTKRMNEIYFAYQQDLMNKPRDEVKAKLGVYLDKIEKWVGGRDKKALAILDLGCGAGEWLELLMEHGYEPKGVDSNYLVISDALKENSSLYIEIEDALDYLEKCSDNCLDVITSLQMIEHLDLPVLFKLFDECRRVLKTGGMLMFTTPNPQNILTATYMFRVDPTHKNPIPVEVLQFYMRKWGFTIYDTIFANPLNYVPYDLSTDDPLKHIVYRFNMEQDYSILAVKE